MNDSTNMAFHGKNNVIVYCVLTSIVWIITCTVLYLLGKLTSSAAEAVAVIGVFIAIIGATWKVTVSKLVITRRSYFKLALASIATVALLIGGVIYYLHSNPFFALWVSYRANLPGLSNIAASNSVPSSVSNSGSESYTPTIPFCESQSGDFWHVPQPGTSLTCTTAGLVMRQSSVENYAEVILDPQYEGSPYGVSINVAFQVPTDTQTWAGVIVQAPSGYAALGGYIFKLNALGQWQLEHILGKTNTVVIASGVVTINPNKAVALSVSVPGDGKLYCYVNNKQVFSWRDSLGYPSGALGLIVTHAHGMSSSVIYSDFVPQGYAKH